MNNSINLDERLSVPHDCYLILTAKCNMRCRHCYGRYGTNIPQKELSGKDWEKVFTDLEEHNVFFLNISGGEPTVHPDFTHIIKSLVKHKIHFILTTNGVFNKEILNTIISAKKYLVGLKISLDGSTEKEHSFLRRDSKGKENPILFKKTIDTIEKLKKNNIPFSIATCLHKKNIQNLENLLQFIIELKPVSWFLSTISVDGRSKENSEIFASDSEVTKNIWQQIINKCEKNNIYVRFIDMPYATQKATNKDFRYTCPAAKLFCEINSDGLVSPCPLARLNIPTKVIKFDNIKKKSIKKIWNGKSFTKFLDLSKDGCQGCKLKKHCGRCIPQSYAWFNTHNKPTPYCISKGEELELKNLKSLRDELKANAERLNRDLPFGETHGK